MPSRIFNFRPYKFIEETGEITIDENSVTKVLGQLPPQPSKLLTLLIEHHPNLVSHQQIREAIWPNVTVDYDRSLHFCIRQIRASLKENASEPRFIETIPKKGYRWMVPTEEVAAGQKSNPTANNAKDSILSKILALKIHQVLILLSTAMALSIFLINYMTSESAQSNTTLRLGILPLQPQQSTSAFLGNDLALLLLEKLNRFQDDLHVIGPSTTEKHEGSKLSDLSAALDLDIIINARFSQQADTSKILAEIIRSSDGAHVWVNYYDHFTPTDQIADEIISGVQLKFLPVE